MKRIHVPLGDRAYDVVVGAGARAELAGVLPATARRAAVVTQDAVGWTVETGVLQETFTIGPGEAAKTMATVEELCRQLARWGLRRGDVVVAVGGGVVTDIAGFAAAVYHRGVPVVHVATTLLGQIDAAIGGKTGVNVPEGKNLIGAFWQPAAVLCDTETLRTLPPREYRSGMGEMAKYHFLGGEGLAELTLEDQVARCVQIKVDVVCADEREGGLRATLNYGHTLAHALETVGRYDLMHGEAVAIGLIYAALLAQRLGRIDDGRVEAHRAVVSSYDLPSSLPSGSDPDLLVEVMRRDKKSTGGLRFVLDGPHGVEPVDVDADIARAVLKEMV